MPYPSLDPNLEKIVKEGAQKIAYEFELDYVGTEHILLAILRYGQGVGVQILHSFRIDEPKARAAIEKQLQADKEDTWVFGRLPGSPHYRNVVSNAIAEATEMSCDQVRSEHMLLALLREEGSTAQRVLDTLGVTLEKCRKKTIELLKD